MIDYAPPNFRYPSTRYSGSKRKLLDWIWENVKGLKFNTVLDVFGGTGVVSLLFKRYGKQVFYNDLLKFNQVIGTAVIENTNVVVTDKDIHKILRFNDEDYPNFIQTNFKGIFFLEHENIWLDKVVANISKISNKYKRCILFSALFQACLAKRPFNLFHRANLYLRTAKVPRSFGNKTTWETPFSNLLERFAKEYNKAVFDNGFENRVIGGHDVFNAPNGVDLVYIDPPYFSTSSDKGTNYLLFYHFLEGIADYKNWKEGFNGGLGKIRRLEDSPEIQSWTHKTKIRESFERLIERVQDSYIVLSYQSNGIPSRDEIKTILSNYKPNVKIFTKPHRYVLSKKIKEELLFIAT